MRLGGTAAVVMAAALAGAPAAVQAQAGPTGPNPPSVRADAPGVMFVRTKMALFAYAAPTETAVVIDEVVGQTVLQASGCEGGWCRIVMARAKPGFIRQNLLEPVTPR